MPNTPALERALLLCDQLSNEEQLAVLVALTEWVFVTHFLATKNVVFNKQQKIDT